MSVNVGSLAFDRHQFRHWLPGSGDASVDFLWVVLALTLVRGVIYAVLNPPFGSPDEKPHFEYVANLATAGASGPRGDEAYQPVPYYALMVPAYWLTAGASPEVQDLAIRLAGLPFLLGVVLFTWLAGRRMAPGKPFVPVVAAAFVGLHPQLAYIGASANNDNAANFMAAVLTYLMVTLLAGNAPRWAIPATAVAIGVALMTKGQILPVVAVCVAALLGVVVQRAVEARSTWLLLSIPAAALLSAIALSTKEGANHIERTRLALSTLEDWRAAVGIAERSGLEPLSYQFVSFWAAFLGESVHPAVIWYLLPGLVMASGLAGYALGGPRAMWRVPWRLAPIALRVFLGVALVGGFLPAYLVYLWVHRMPGYPWTLQQLQGRYTLVSLATLALLVADGISSLPQGRVARPTLLSVAALALLAAFDAGSIASLAGHHSWPASG